MEENFEKNIKQNNKQENIERLEEKAVSFDQGVDQAVSRILNIFENTEDNVYIRIQGSGSQVGKSFLLGAIQRQLITLRIPTRHTEVFGQKLVEKTIVFTVDHFQNEREEDLLIAIYRPDKRFDRRDFHEKDPDILIRNDQAKNR